MKKLLFIFLTLMVGIPIASFAQEEMSLEKAIALGMENNFGIKVDERSIQIAENNNSWARAGRGPVVNLSANFSNNLINNNNPASFLQGTYYTGSLGGTVDANWVVFNGGRIRINKSQLDLAVNQQKLNRNTAIHDLIKAINQAYYEVLFQEERLKVLLENSALSRKRLAYEQVKKDFGSSNTYNLLQFENNLIADSTNLIRQEQQIEQAKRNLYNTLSLEGFPNYRFTEQLATIVEEINPEKLKETLAEENYTLKSLQLIAALDALNTKLALAARKPMVSINAALGASENAFNFFADNPATGEPFEFILSNQFNAAIGANLSWNLYDGGLRKQDVENAKLQEEIAQMNNLEAKVALYNQLDILISNYENQKTLLKLSDDQIQIAAKNLEMTGERFKSGLLSSIDFRNIQNQYLNAAFNKVSAIYNIILSKTEIDYLVGKFKE